MTIRLSTRPRLWFVKPFPTNQRKRTLIQKIKTWRRNMKKYCYKLDGQIAMF